MQAITDQVEYGGKKQIRGSVQEMKCAHTASRDGGMCLQSKTGSVGSYLEVILGQWQQENG